MDMSKLVRDMRDSAYVVAPFDEGLEILSNAGYSLVSPKDLAELRIREGRYSNVSMKESWTTFGVLYVPNKGKYLTKNSPIMMDPKGTTEAHKNRKDFYPTPEQIERGLADAVEIESGEIPAEIFGEHPVTVYAFGDSAQKYGDFLRRIKILKVPVWLRICRINLLLGNYEFVD